MNGLVGLDSPFSFRGGCKPDFRDFKLLEKIEHGDHALIIGFILGFYDDPEIRVCEFELLEFLFERRDWQPGSLDALRP
jgi:hypothetical protein